MLNPLAFMENRNLTEAAVAIYRVTNIYKMFFYKLIYFQIPSLDFPSPFE